MFKPTYIINALQIHQMDLIWYNKKLLFYSSFKTTETISIQSDLVKNMQHRQAVAKLSSGNHDLRIETGRYCVPKTPENLRICQHCLSNDAEHETHFLFECSLQKCAKKKTFYDEIISKYPNFINFSTIGKILFLFNSTGPFICKK